MIHRMGQWWRFSVSYSRADRVFLVKDCPGQASCWTEMQPDGDGRWILEEQVGPGPHRFRYFAAEGRTYLNCGDTGLTATPIGEPSAENEPEMAQSA